MLIISIIVPIYNAEKGLEKCIDSILNQTIKNIEIILVDDGSIDKSMEICQRYAALDNRIRIIHQENSGVSAARNRGLSIAKGKYVGFVDSDDWIEPNMFEKMTCEAENTKSDIVMCDAITVYDNGKTKPDTIIQLSEKCTLKRENFTPLLLLEMAGSACRCIYRKDKYCEESKIPLKFPIGIKFSEDRIFNLYAIGQANQLVYIKEGYYNRYINEKSAVHSFHEDYFEACKKSANEIRIAIKKVWMDNQQLQKAYLGQLIGNSFSAICNYYYKTSTLSNYEKKKKLKMICNDEQLRVSIAQYGLNWKSRLIFDKKYRLLIIYAKLANLKHGR